jgi:hypothetical protein
MLQATYTQGNQGDSQLLVAIWLPAFFLAITYVLSVQMGHASPF